jgi:hypothetical protein
LEVCLGLLGALLLRKLVRMDGHHELRVFLLTVPLWALVIYLFVYTFLSSAPRCTPLDAPCAFSCVMN